MNYARVGLVTLFLGSGSSLVFGQVYVSDSNGNDSNPGTQALPVRTIQGGINRAVLSGEPIYVEQGTYTDNFVVATGVRLFGGFQTGFAERAPAQFETAVCRDENGIRAVGVQDVLIDGITFSSADVPPSPFQGAGLSSNPLYFQASSNLFISNCVLVAGKGSYGSNGQVGVDAKHGTNGALGQPGCEDDSGFCGSCSQPQGGSGGLVAWGANGGRGGVARKDLEAGFAGLVGEGVGGGSGGAGTAPELGDWCPVDVHTGADGLDGAVGAPGVGGGGFGFFSLSVYVPAPQAGVGGEGSNGGGGGGGGGGGVIGCNSYGAGGGGGGAGGQGGRGGSGGFGGGGSFALWFSGCTNVVVTDCNIMTAGGGNGGMGGAGGVGGNGGAGAETECNRGNSYGGSGDQDDGSNGGRGGDGGNGGDGGTGGGGGGGPSLGIVNANTAADVGIFDNAFDVNAGGEGGNNGATGIEANVLGPSTTIVVTPDCDGNGTHDEVDIANGADCNANDIPDACDLSLGTSSDVDMNGIPDDCEPAGTGDFNVDQDVDLEDYENFVWLCFRGPMVPWETPCHVVDFDEDGDVDLADFRTFQLLYTGTPVPPAR